MPECHWHPDRDAVARCDTCKRHVCDACATNVAQPPETCRICPECLASLEHLVERGLDRAGSGVPARRTWAGAAAGAAVGLAMWIGVSFAIDPSWYVPTRWIGSLSCAVLSAYLSVKISSEFRGPRVTVASLTCTVVALATGYYVTTNMLSTYLQANPDLWREFVDAGLSTMNPGFWLPVGSVLGMAPRLVTWMDYGTILVVLYATYALTHRRRLWSARRRWFT